MLPIGCDILNIIIIFTFIYPLLGLHLNDCILHVYTIVTHDNDNCLKQVKHVNDFLASVLPLTFLNGMHRSTDMHPHPTSHLPKAHSHKNICCSST